MEKIRYALELRRVDINIKTARLTEVMIFTQPLSFILRTRWNLCN